MFRCSTRAVVLMVSTVVLSGCTELLTTPVMSAPGTTTTIIMVRHAERNPGEAIPPSEPLNEEGFARADALADELADVGITAIYLPDLTRNMQTIDPLLERITVEPVLVSQIDIIDTRALANRLVDEWLTDHAGGTVLWVGNTGPVTDTQSGNLQEIYARFGVEGRPPTTYPDLYFITVDDQGMITVDMRTYGEGG